MMKKEYFAPEMEIVEISSNISLLAGSLGSGDTPVTDLDDAIPGTGLDAESPDLGLGLDLFGM